MCSVLCAVFHFKFVVFNLQFAVSKVQSFTQCSLCDFFCQVSNVQCAVWSMQSAVYSALGSFSFPVYNVQCAVFSVSQYNELQSSATQTEHLKCGI